MKKALALMLTGMLTLSLCAPAMAETAATDTTADAAADTATDAAADTTTSEASGLNYDMIDDSVPGEWITIDDIFDIYVPKDWIEQEITDEQDAQGVVLVMSEGEDPKTTNALSISYVETEEAYTSEDLALAAYAYSSDALIIDINGIECYSADITETASILFVPIDEYTYYCLAISTVDEDQTWCKNLVSSICLTEDAPEDAQ